MILRYCEWTIYTYILQKPMNLHLEPDYGPVAGGTKITVTGELLGDDTVTVRVTLSEVLDDVEK